jgi:hypothetical protein
VAPFARWHGPLALDGGPTAAVRATFHITAAGQPAYDMDLNGAWISESSWFTTIVEEPNGRFHDYLGASWDYEDHKP